MQRIYNVDKWTHLPKGKTIQFPGERPRRVRLEVNSPGKIPLYLTSEDGEVRFLALVEGRDTVEFSTEGKFGLMAGEGDVFIYTADGDDISSVVEAPVSFTKIMERRPRNYELERIAAEMQYNMNRRLEQQAHELEQLFSRRAAALSEKPAAPNPPGRSGGKPAKGGDGQPSDPPSAGTDS